MDLLHKLNLPGDLKKLSLKELHQVAKETRQLIIDNVSQTGGHLAPSLGVVELSIALHAVLNSPQDKIIWDVGHQAYPHKILTGRAGRFHTLRQKDGLSGFTKREESVHDVFGAGHASTSISAALGIAKARDINKENYAVFAVIGDGALSGGLAFEALNNVHEKVSRKFCVVLNDNDMSINKPVGMISKIITGLRVSMLYVKLRRKIERMLSHIPQIGQPLAEKIDKFVERTRELLLPQPEEKVSVLFEEFGFRYIGPIDGYNLPMLMGAIRYAKEADQPVILHVLTKKGKGYQPAEIDPTKYHGVAPAKLVLTDESKTFPAYTEIFSKTLVRLAKEDKKIFAITAAMAEGTGLTEFEKIFPGRFIDVGIAEEHAVTMAAGMATEGLKPIVAIYSTFLQRAYDQIIHDVCLQKLPVTFVMDRGGIVGEDGPTHAGIFDFSFMRHIPNLVVMAPKDENELQHMMYTAVNHPGPITLRYPRGECLGVALDQKLKKLEIGKGEIVYQSPWVITASDENPKTVSMIAIGSMVYPAIEAGKKLEAQGYIVKVINARFVKPLDQELILRQSEKADLVVTLEENVLAGGFGSAVVELFTQKEKNIPVKMIGIPDEFIPQGKISEIKEYYKLRPEDIALQIREYFEKQKKLHSKIKIG
ncbi:MAG: 1-deoxy-D-xylulose-5-phosphate synthase [Candidatus Margulisbacteria bacterium]|nr:1-deoxy-D-xylulose-5-phosphate synthase [Candidatus Margulisiibacteriota bacterium]